MYSSSHLIRVIKSRRTRWAGHMAGMGGGKGTCRVSVGKSQGKRTLGTSGVDGR